MQAPGRLIGQNQFRLADHGSGHGHDLLLAAGKLIGKQRLLAHDLKAVEDIGHHSFAFGLFYVPVGKREVEIFRDGQIVQQVILLKDEADVLFVELDATAVVEFVHRVIGEVIFAFPRAVQHADDAHERGFAGAGGPHDGDEIAFANFEVDAAEHPGLPCSGFVKFFYINQLDQETHLRWFTSKIIRGAARSWGQPAWRDERESNKPSKRRPAAERSPLQMIPDRWR